MLSYIKPKSFGVFLRCAVLALLFATNSQSVNGQGMAKEKRANILSRIESLSNSMKARIKTAFRRDTDQTAATNQPSAVPNSVEVPTQSSAEHCSANASCRCQGNCRYGEQKIGAGVPQGIRATKRTVLSGPSQANLKKYLDQSQTSRIDPEVAEMKRLMRSSQSPEVNPAASDGFQDPRAPVVTAQHRLEAPIRDFSHPQPMRDLSPPQPMRDLPVPEPSQSFSPYAGSQMGETPYIGSRLPAANVTATEHALKLRQENESLKSSQRSMSADNKQLRDQLRSTQDLLRRTEVAMQRAQDELTTAEKRNAELKETVARLKLDQSRFAEQTNRMLDSIREELDNALVSEINANR